MRRPTTRRPARAPRRAGVVALVAVLATVVLPAALVSAHEGGHGLVRSEPADGAVVPEPPSEVLLEFEDDVVADRSVVRVIGPGGQDLGRGDAVADGRVIRQPVSTDTVDGVHRIVFEVATRGGGDVQTIEDTLRYTLKAGGCPGRVGIADFTSIAAPEFGSGAQLVTHARPDRTFMDLIYATNGRELHRTSDGGCEWAEVLDLADQGLPADARIATLATAAELPGAVAALVLAPIDGEAGLYEASTFLAPRPDEDLRPGGSGLPPLRLDPSEPIGCERPQPCRFAFADALPTGLAPPLYLLTEAVHEVGVAQLYRSDDLGATFALSTPAIVDPATAGTPLLGAVELAPDPNVPGTIYVSTGRTVHVSTDGGATFSPGWSIPDSDPGVVTHLAAGESVNAQGTPHRDVLVMVGDDVAVPPLGRLLPLVPGEGATLQAGEPLPVAPLGDVRLRSLARGLVPGQVLLLPETDARERPGVWEYERAVGEFRDLDRHEVSPWRHGTSTNPLCTRWFGHDDQHLYLVDADDGHDHAHDIADFCVAPDGAGGSSSVDVVKFPPTEELTGDAALQPRATTVELEPGRPQAVGYRLQRLADDVPLDVAFLFDTSGSMRDNIEQVRTAFQEIVETLGDRGVDAWFGLAEFNDLALRYKRLSDIRPPDDEFSDTLATVSAGGGEQEPHLTALHQLATGAGLDARRGADVPPGQQMNWRPEAVRVVVLASDEPITEDPDGPDMETTLAALNARDIGVVGMHIREELADDAGGSGVDNPAGSARLREEMDQIADGTGTHAVAPVDCDGNGSNDLQRGDPIVCSLSNDAGVQVGFPISTAIAQALADLVDAVRDERPFRLEATVPDGFTVEVIAAGLQGRGDRYPAIDVTLPQNLLFRASFGCTPEAAGTTATVPVAAVLGELVVAEASATLVCAAAAAVTPPVPAPPPAPPLQGAAVAPPPPPPPPAPIPANAPASAASTAISSAPATAAAQAPAVAAAVAPQTQVSTQRAELRTDDDDRTFAFSAVRAERRPAGSPVVVLAGAAMAAAAGALELARRRAGGPVRATVRRRWR